ncbi:Fe2+-dependent dioxygenase [Duganella phyllosphaerae]|uniref:PKHD-type hydroxylase n=1 Tax=Duganella phyllosphaerae TaxID=762836 RepID=A0A1E7X7N5_9BURK|nr:Fe2+-dependent dioxygenase [Duganella phyllosphaerae]OFA09157.1 PKHD-type hydroxylase [Duganella phyllosphaerae]
MLLHIPGVLNREQVAALRARLDTTDWVDGRTTVGAQGAQVKQNRQLGETSPLALELGQVVLAALAASPVFFAAALPLRTIAPLFNSYAGGEHYGAHVDGAMRRMPATAAGPGAWVRTDVSSTLFLSDPDDYDGGELIVTDVYGEHEVKLPAGDLILYPSTSIHRVEPVTRGARVCSFFWTQSMVRDDMRRSMLFELDQNIQSLRARLGDCPELVGLTGHYHNLLRQWSEA